MFETIVPYEKREAMKTEGWDAFNSATTPHGKAGGILRVIDAHYWRVREQLEGISTKKRFLKMIVPQKYSPGYELDIDHYTPHWLHANRKLIPPDVMEVLETQWGYKPVASKYLPDGMSLYTPLDL